MTVTLAVIGCVLLVGTVLQRISGTGVGLVVAPIVALLLGPVTGVLVTNSITAVSGAILTVAVWKQVDWARWAWLCAAAPLGALPGALLVAALPTAWLQVVVGVAVLLGLVVTVGLPDPPQVPVRAGAVVAGAVGGLLNVTAGVSAAAMIVYCLTTRWEHRRYAATMQPTFMTFGVLSVGSKALLVHGGETVAPSWWIVPVVLTGVAAGTVLGARLAPRVPVPVARRMAIGLAGLGACATIVRGLTTL